MSEKQMVEKQRIKKDIIAFGAGAYLENYMQYYGRTNRPLFVVDNDPEKIGKERFGLEVKAIEELKKLEKDTFYIVICSARFQDIENQLKVLGYCDFQRHLLLHEEELTLMEVQENTDVQEEKKKYRIGYVPGAFDLFHIGHLNLLKNSKVRCEYLIVGVLTDELIEHFKGKKPIIPYVQRAAIVGALSCVDRVVPVDFSNTIKIDAWHRYHFDCHFSGNDHGEDWKTDLEQLKQVGSTMEFFQYTPATSSSGIKRVLHKD